MIASERGSRCPVCSAEVVSAGRSVGHYIWIIVAAVGVLMVGWLGLLTLSR